MTERKTSSEGGPVQSLQRGLALLTALSRSEGGLGLVDLAAATRLAPSTVHRLLATLEGGGFVAQETATGRWRIGVGAFSVGQAFLRDRNLVVLARPVMARLVARTEETSNLAVAVDGSAVYVAQAESPLLMRAFARLGSRVPLHASGVGKALLSGLAEGERRRRVADLPLPRLTLRTLTEPEALIADLSRSAARGFATDDEEHAVGLRCAAAPVFDDKGDVVAAISVSGPAARIDDGRLAEYGRAVAEAAAELSRMLGGERAVVSSDG